jgi:sucrose-6-phosphate hydrolase SacC (GH32 family)
MAYIRFQWLLLCLIAGLIQTAAAQTDLIIPGGDWRDSNGNLIAATEGGIIKVDSLYYLWGMDRSANNYAFVGINLYSSPDLKNWTFVNQILKKTSHPDLDNDAVVERAKILHNKKTGQFVMWMHYEGHNAYKTAEVGLATCSTIGGDYTFHSHFRPLDIDSRDINVYQDDDGRGYLICTTKGNQNVSLFELDSTYTKVVREIYRGSASDDMECEGHAIIKNGGYYFWLMSWCTGWDFNDNHYFYATKLAGPWTAGGMIATSNTHTYESQVGFAVTVKGSNKTTFLYTGDRWAVNNYSMSRIVLLPIEVNGTRLSVKWYDQYNIDAQSGEWSAGARYFPDGIYTITAKHSGMVLGTTSGSAVQQQTLTGANSQLWRIQNIGASHFKITSVASGKVLDVSGSSREAGAKILQYDWNDGYNQKWHVIDCGDGYHRLVSVNTLGKTAEISGSSKSSGAEAVLGNFSYKDNQLWRIVSADKEIISGQCYRIENRTTRMALDASSTGLISQQTSQNKTSQIWKLEDLYNGCFTVISTAGNLVLDIGGDFSVFCQRADKRFSQQWQILQVEKGCYKITNRFNAMVLEGKEDGRVRQSTDNSSTSNSQQWYFIPVDPVSIGYSSRDLLPVKDRVPGINSDDIIYDLNGRVIKRNGIGLSAMRMISRGVYLIKKADNREIGIRCFSY